MPMLLVSPPDVDGFDVGVSKVYGPAKRRKISATRHFPMGCGRNSSVAGKEGHLRPQTAAPAAANIGNLVSLKESKGGQRSTVSTHTGAALSSEAIIGNQVKKTREEPNSVGHSEMDTEKAAQSWGTDRSSPVLLPLDDMFNGGFSKLYSPAKKRRISAVRHFPAGCGRGAAAVHREELEAAQDGHSEMDQVGRTEESLTTLESRVKEEPDEAKGEGSKMKRQKAEASLGNPVLQCSTKSKNKLSAIRHFPVGLGGQAREGAGLSGEGEAESISESASNGSAMAALGRPSLAARTPSPSTGRAAEEDGRGSEVAMVVQVRAERIVQALMASPNCPWSRGRRSAK